MIDTVVEVEPKRPQVFGAIPAALDGHASVWAGRRRSGGPFGGRTWSARGNPCYCVAVGVAGPNGAGATGSANPAHIVTVQDFSRETLSRIVAYLEVSTDFEHLVYREAELDAIWSITGFFVARTLESVEREAAMRLHKGAHHAHDLVGQNRPLEAAALLRKFL
jgi:hypothetical protein